MGLAHAREATTELKSQTHASSELERPKSSEQPVLEGSWDLVIQVISMVKIRMTLLRGLITPVITRLTKSPEPLSTLRQPNLQG